MARLALFCLVTQLATASAFADGGVVDGGLIDGDTADGGAADAGPTDGGAGDGGDGGAVDCTLRCDGTRLVFCDSVTGAQLAVDCAELSARCGLLDDDWGLDCLLPEGEPCAPGYAEGRSRCDPQVPLYCNGGVCSTEPGEGRSDPTIPGNAGGIGQTPSDNQNPLACLGCDDSNTPDVLFPSFFAGMLGFRLRRRLFGSRAG